MSRRALRLKVKAEKYDIVHYFFDTLDNATYMDNNVHFDKLDFKDSTYIDTVIREVQTRVRNNAKARLSEEQRELFETKKQECNNAQSSVTNDERSQKEIDEAYINNNKAMITISTVNRFKCSLCGSQLRHVFVAQDRATNEKVMLGKTCVKCLVPNGGTVIKKHQRLGQTYERLRRLILTNRFDMAEHVKNARVTESSLVKQLILIENTYPTLAFDATVRFAIETLCFTRNRTVRACFVAWKGHTNRVKHALDVFARSFHRVAVFRSFREWVSLTKERTLEELLSNGTVTEACLVKQMLLLTEAYPYFTGRETVRFAMRTLCFDRIRKIKKCFRAWKNRITRTKTALQTLSEAIHTSHIVVLLHAMYRWKSFVETFHETIDFRSMSTVQIRDSINVMVSLLEDSDSPKQCYLKLSSVTVSVHTNTTLRYNFIHVHGSNIDVPIAINQIERGLKCTKVTMLMYPLSLKHTNAMVFYDQNGEAFEPFTNHVYTECKVKVLLKKYTFNNTIGLSRICMDVHTTQ